MKTSAKAIAHLNEVTRFNTVIWALAKQGYWESRTRLRWEADRQYLRDRYLACLPPRIPQHRVYRGDLQVVQLYPLPPSSA